MMKKRVHAMGQFVSGKSRAAGWSVISLSHLLNALSLLGIFMGGTGGISQAHAVVYETPKAKVAIIIDDIGKNPQQDLDCLDAQIPITLAVLPNSTAGPQLAKKAHARGATILVHMPMEPENLKMIDGPEFLMTISKPHKLKRMIKKHLKSIPQAVGINNHMGSGFTQNEQRMHLLLKLVKTKKLFFVDSRTSPDTVGEFVARKLKIPTISRDIFIDNECQKGACTAEDVYKNLLKAEKLAYRQFQVVVIGHPFPETVAALKKWSKTIKKERIQLVTIDKLVN